MPREQQKRGRRAAEKAKKTDTKRKRDETTETHVVKRRKPSADDTEMGDFVPLDDGRYQEQGGEPTHTDDTPFYGLLDSEEQEYFSRANEVLELNQFADSEERRLFIESVYREANGKELKVACSQSCSRLLEKLISLSDLEQIRRLFNKFIGHFLHLVQHRFASHCCETLFIHAAPGVSQKATKSQRTQIEEDDVDEADAEPQLTLAQMFLKVVEELESNWGYLLTERFASHTVRVLLLVLAGEPVDVSSNDSVVASRKKERLTVPGLESQPDNGVVQKKRIPEEFESTLQQVMKAMVADLDDTYFRALATHPTGNPVLQVLLYLELAHFGKSTAKESTSITRRLIPDDSFGEGSESTKFIQGLLYDPVGSRLLETIVRWAPGKLFKSLYKNLFRERIGSLARNVTAGYVVVRILERLGKDDLQSAVEVIVPEIPSLIERSRLIVPRALVERCAVRGVATAQLADAFEAAYDKDPSKRLLQILKLQATGQDQTAQFEREEKKTNNDGSLEQNGPKTAEKLHGSLLAQSMVSVPGPLSELIFSSLLAQSTDCLVAMSKDPTASRVLQSALMQPTSTLQFRRQFTARFYGQLKDLALDASGSHVVDALWTATKDVFFVKERMADELVQNEFALRDSFIGRAVWRNWSLDLYKRRRGEWKAKAKGLDPAVDSVGGGRQHDRPKSKIELARERYASKVGEQEKDADMTRRVATKS